jgi:hypothetical protein
MASSWVLVPCLVTLRGEFNRVAPDRDKGADGSVGDISHAAKPSDHNPDETGNTPTEDADKKNEVHAVDVDSTGSWPDGKGGEAGAWFDRKVRAVAARERVEYESATLVGRLQNIIWRGQVISRSWGWSEWRAYGGPSGHFDHAHFSARYLSSTESDTRPWGVAEEEDIVTPDDITKIAAKVWAYPISSPSLGISARAAADWQKDAEQVSRELAAMGKSLSAAVTALAAKDAVDEQALGAALAPGLAVALAPLLQDLEVTPEQLQAAILGALRELAK